MTISVDSPLLRSAGFACGFSLRGEGDELDRFLRAVGLEGSVLRQAKQVHGARVVRAGSGAGGDTRREEADALVALERGVAVGMRVADCVPVLVADPRTGAVAAIHAGWRGVVAGVVPAALDEIARLSGSSAVGMLAAIGPSIGPCCFEVGGDVAAQIADAVGDDAVIARRAGEKAYVDLRRAVRAQLARAGVGAGVAAGAGGVGDRACDIEDVAGCTKCDAERFYSFRRDGANAGRMLAVIGTRA